MSSYQFILLALLVGFFVFVVISSCRHAVQVQRNNDIKQKLLESAGEAQKDVERSMLQQDKVIAELREIKQILKDKGN
jgi:uncharacterized membrane protein